MKKLIILGMLLLFSASSFANPPDLTSFFKGETACFILWDNSKNKIITRYNPARCAKRLTPNSTFKVALSLMAFDQKIITQKTVFKWDGKTRGLPAWNQNQTPKTWLQYSAVWVSQSLTPELGMATIQRYLKDFHYGNQSFIGDPNQNNGLAHAWLDSSLQISADEQLRFLRALFSNALPVSQTAMTDTRENMYLETSPKGWKLFGKTGAGIYAGWFVGFVEKANQSFVFVLNFSDNKVPVNLRGVHAKDQVKSLLTQMGMF